MSHKEMLSVKTRQIPRIFQRQKKINHRSSLTSFNTTEDAICTREQTENPHSDLLYDSSHEYQHFADGKVKQGKKSGSSRSTTKEVPEKMWNAQSCQINDDSTGTQNTHSKERTADAEIVANIDKWLKVRTDSVSSMDLESMRSEGSVPSYLGNELQHTFLVKDTDLAIDIDLSEKKLNLAYDPILHELQNEKLLDTCTSDEFRIPGLQYDPLDPLELAPDMVVAGEILPSTSALSVSSLSVANDSNDRLTFQQVSSLNFETDSDLCDKSTQVYVRDFDRSVSVNSELISEIHGEESRRDVESYIIDENILGGPATVEFVNDLSEAGVSIRIVDDRKALKMKTKESGIAKKRKTLTERKLANTSFYAEKKDNPIDNSDIMSLVAISTDKISNMTQIVINNGKEEQIYQGKTSELIEATGNFPRIDTTMWNGSVDSGTDNSVNSHDVIISNALEDLGYTDEILQPVSTADQGKTWICPKDCCGRHFNRLYALKSHLLTHYGVRPYKCDFEGCAWAFYSEFKLKRHKETHLKKKNHVCEVAGCQRRFTTIYNLWSHKKLHQRPNRIVCNVPHCEEKFQTKRALEIHMKSHDQSHAPYVCKHEGCGKRYYSSNALISHQRCHSYKDTDIKCGWPGCGKVFDKPCRLKAHVRSHTGSKPYPCMFQGCTWAFASSSKLRRHQKKHTNDRKFVCEVASCGKAFMRSEHLKEHRLTHSVGRYFQCHMCDSRFSAKSSLYVHIKKHQAKTDHHKKDASAKSPSKESLPSKEKHSNPSDDLALETELQTKIISLEDVSRSDQHIKKPPIKKPETQLQCPVETCKRFYTSQATLRSHLVKMHGTVEKEVIPSKPVCTDPVPTPDDGDYIVYAPYSISPNDQMIMVSPCDAVIFSSSPESNVLLEPESPRLTSVLKRKQPHQGETHRRRDQGSARTGLTYTDHFKIKSRNTNSESAVGASDVILGSADLGEGLLLTEDLPSSLYFQDDLGGTECQVLLLDSGVVCDFV